MKWVLGICDIDNMWDIVQQQCPAVANILYHILDVSYAHLRWSIDCILTTCLGGTMYFGGGGAAYSCAASTQIESTNDSMNER